jgi:hypothetical protein
LASVYPILYFDALIVKSREAGPVKNKAVAKDLRAICGAAPRTEAALARFGETRDAKYPASAQGGGRIGRA